MFGFSLQKLAVLLAIVVAVLWVYRNKGRFQGLLQNLQKASVAKRNRDTKPVAEDTFFCKSCESYVVLASSRSCKQASCPFGKS